MVMLKGISRHAGSGTTFNAGLVSMAKYLAPNQGFSVRVRGYIMKYEVGMKIAEKIEGAKEKHKTKGIIGWIEDIT